MFTETFYLIRSKADGRYVAARPQSRNNPERDELELGYLLLFKEHFEALSYLNTHGADVVDRFAIEPMPESQVGSLVKRWGYTGVGIVRDPLLPSIEFLQQS